MIEYDVIPLYEVMSDVFPDLSAAVREAMAIFPCCRSEHVQRFIRERAETLEKSGWTRT